MKDEGTHVLFDFQQRVSMRTDEAQVSQIFLHTAPHDKSHLVISQQLSPQTFEIRNSLLQLNKIKMISNSTAKALHSDSLCDTHTHTCCIHSTHSTHTSYTTNTYTTQTTQHNTYTTHTQHNTYTTQQTHTLHNTQHIYYTTQHIHNTPHTHAYTQSVRTENRKISNGAPVKMASPS